jgi:HisA/HisF family protein
LLGGRAVHARAGERHTYAPVASVAGDAVRLAQRYLEAGVTDLYVADLSAILSGARQDGLITALVGLGAPVWLDAGVTTIPAAKECLSLGASHVIVGLETLTSFDALAAICVDVGGSRVAFSLDLRNNEPVSLLAPPASPALLAHRAVASGAGTIIVLDLARVGTASGIDLGLMKDIRALAPRVTLLAGGGIRGADDLERLAEAGCDGALVATAFHNGRIGASEIQSVSR